MKKIKYCQVSNCYNYSKGRICTTHRYRWNTYSSYDLPSYKGEPNYLPDDNVLPDGIIRLCKKHGTLTIDDCYDRPYQGVNTLNHSYVCRKCIRDGNIRRNFEEMNDMEDYQTMWDRQKGLCAICSKPSTQRSNNRKSIKSLAVDHDHVTNKVRELLCGACNSLLGYAEDSIDILQKCIAYLQKHAPT